jgi:hypothetical protein
LLDEGKGTPQIPIQNQSKNQLFIIFSYHWLLRKLVMSLPKESLNLVGSSGTIPKLEQTSQWLT